MDKPSTTKLELLYPPNKIQQLCKSISAIEAIICQEWEYRYYSYQNNWSETEEFCEMRNGSGDQMLILFSNNGICINGFDHKSEISGWKRIPKKQKKSLLQKLFNNNNQETELIQEIHNGIVGNLPHVFHEFIFGEPVKSIGTTFCIWKTNDNSKWTKGYIDLPNLGEIDGSKYLLELLDGKAETYKKWAESYYEDEFAERELDLSAIQKIYDGDLITLDLIQKINPILEDLDKLKSDLDEIGYNHNL